MSTASRVGCILRLKHGTEYVESVLIKKHMRHIRGVKCVFYIQLKSEALPLAIFETSHAALEIAFIQRRTMSMHRLNQYFGHMTKVLSRRRTQTMTYDRESCHATYCQILVLETECIREWHE